MRKRKCILAAIVALSFVSTAYGAATPSYDMEEIIVNADREHVINQAPIDATNINVKYVNPGGQQSLTDILNQATGIDIRQRSGRGDNQDGTVMLRGVDARRFVVLVDGVPTTMSGVMAGTYMDWDSIPVSTIDRIEIIKGAKSAEYGNTVGGVINIITKKAATAGGEVSVLRGQYNKQQYQFNYGAKQDKLSWQVHYDKASEDPFLRNNTYDATKYGVNLGYSFSPQDEWKVNVRQSQEKRGYILANVPGQSDYDPAYPVIGSNEAEKAYSNYTVHNGAYWKKYNTNLDTSWTHRRDNGFLTLGYWQSRERRQEVDYTATGAVALDRTIISDKSSGYFIKGESKVGTNTYHYGFDYKQLRYGYGWYNVLPAGSSGNDLYPSQKINLAGLYFDNTWNLSERWTGNVGLRYDSMKGSNDDAQGNMPSVNYNSLSPKFNFSFRNNDTTSTFISIDRLWRAPSMAEYWGWSISSPMKIAAGAGLKPEKGWSYETGVRHRFSDDYTTKFAFYYNDLSDYISFQHSYPFNCYNVPNAKIWGVEWENDFRLSEVSRLLVNYTNLHTKKSGTLAGDTAGLSGELDYEPRHKVGLTYIWDQQPWQFRCQMTYTGPQTTLYGSRSSYTTARIGGYVIANAALTKEIGKGRTCTLAVDNLFDKQYVEEYGYPMQGRVVSLSITQKI